MSAGCRMTERFPAIRVTMLPRDTNAHGTIFGGVILSYIDLAGGIECRRRSPKKFVTKAMHEVVFVAPVHLVSPSGMLANAVLGYLRTLLRIIKERKPEYMAAVFEKDTSFRNGIFEGYKANRKQPPADLEAQFEYCRKITDAIGVACFEVDDYEADDVIGTIAARMSGLGHPVLLVTGDQDMTQLVCDSVRIYDIAKEQWLDEGGVREKFGVAPS